MTAVWLFVLYLTAQGLMVKQSPMPSFEACLVEMDLALTSLAFDVGVRAAMCRESYVPESA